MSKNSNIVLTKTYGSYGINITNSYTDFDLIGKELKSNPLVYFYNSFGKAIFDYSETVDLDDIELLNLFLQGISQIKSAIPSIPLSIYLFVRLLSNDSLISSKSIGSRLDI